MIRHGHNGAAASAATKNNANDAAATATATTTATATAANSTAATAATAALWLGHQRLAQRVTIPHLPGPFNKVQTVLLHHGVGQQLFHVAPIFVSEVGPADTLEAPPTPQAKTTAPHLFRRRISSQNRRLPGQHLHRGICF